MMGGSLFFDGAGRVAVRAERASNVGDDDLWHHHIGRFSSFFSFLFELRASWKGFQASKLGGPWSQLGGSWIQLGGAPSKLGKPMRKLQRWEVPG